MNSDQEKLSKFLNTIKNDEHLDSNVKIQAGELLTEFNGPIYTTDLWIYRLVVIILGTTVLSTILGGLFLAFKGDTNYKLPAEIVAIGSAAVGALAGLLAPAPQNRS